jgi:exodeoxyribonuclease V alpha subunit
MKNSHPIDTDDFADIDRHFAKFIAEFGGGETIARAAQLLSRNVRLGHTCLDLAELPESVAALAKNGAVGNAEAALPLVLEGAARLYLRRYWEYERSLADAILSRCDASAAVAKSEDLQQTAIDTALRRRFVVISGGPGTGKTTTVFKILRELVKSGVGGPLRIALAAPTGKAAARLQETLRAACDDELRKILPETASTIHRLLGPRHGSVYFRHDAKNPLPLDVLVVDEASMVALPLVAKLLAALPPHARVILLGDRDQLSSVEPGAVLGDIADAASQLGGKLSGSLVVLKKNYRFGNDSPIFSLCEAVRAADADCALEILRGDNRPVLDAGETPAPARLTEKLRAPVLAGFGAFANASDPAEALREFQKFRILCAHRNGPYGVGNLNRIVEAILRQAGAIDPGAQHYRGRPVLVTRNDYQLRLFNGDIGILLPDPGDGRLCAWFPGEDGNPRRIPAGRLPEHETAFAMTVHKSQGSEFGGTLLILPENDSPLLTRELVYTGLTRAREHAGIWFREPVLRAAIMRRQQRSSGLVEKLAG